MTWSQGFLVFVLLQMAVWEALALTFPGLGGSLSYTVGRWLHAEEPITTILAVLSYWHFWQQGK